MTSVEIERVLAMGQIELARHMERFFKRPECTFEPRTQFVRFKETCQLIIDVDAPLSSLGSFDFGGVWCWTAPSATLWGLAVRGLPQCRVGL